MFTVKQFWTAFFFYIAFFVMMILCAFTFGQATIPDTSGYSADELYQLDLETIPALDYDPFFALMKQSDYRDFPDLIQNGQPNFVARVTLTARRVCQVYDPFGYYTNDQLSHFETGADRSKASYYICTPYDCKIEDVLIGNKEIFKEGDHFLFYAPYGIIGDQAVRYEDCPIFSEKREYILFFSVLDVTGVGRWYDLTHPSAAAEIMVEDERTFYSMTHKGDDLFRDVGFDTEKLVSELKRLYEDNPYPLDIPSITPINPYKND